MDITDTELKNYLIELSICYLKACHIKYDRYIVEKILFEQDSKVRLSRIGFNIIVSICSLTKGENIKNVENINDYFLVIPNDRNLALYISFCERNNIIYGVNKIDDIIIFNKKYRNIGRLNKETLISLIRNEMKHVNT